MNAAPLVTLEGQPALVVRRGTSSYQVSSDVAGFDISADGSAVRVSALPEVRARAATILEHRVLRMVYQLRGAPSLHASALSTERGVIAFFGPSGAGKSTLAALASTGSPSWPLVADDYLVIELAADAAMVTPTAAAARVRGDVPDLAGEAPPTEDDELAGKRRVVLPIEREARPLRALYAIDATDSAEITIEPMRRGEATLAIAASLHRLDPFDPQLLRAELAFIGDLTARVPVRRLRYPRTRDGARAARAALDLDLRKASP
ncbi:MAG: hypothetical protein U0271_42390 [Polyangiaceae bacterium]